MPRRINLLKASPEVRKEIKRQVYSLLKKRMKHKLIAETLNISPETVHNYSKELKNTGKAFFFEKKRGRKRGEKKALTKAQEREIANIVVDQCPEQQKLPFALWNRKAVQQLIKQTYGVEISLRCVSNYLKSWGFSSQRPVKRSASQNEAELKEFMEETYPSIKKKSVKEGAAIYWGDETGLNNQEYYLKGFAPKGHPPTIASYSKRESINMISAITNQGACSFLCYEENMTAELFIDFMERLRKDAGRKVLFIVDNLRVHHSKAVSKWLEDNREKVELYFISRYSPEINPDEYLNHNLKQDVHSGIPPRDRKELLAKTESFMKSLQTDGTKVKKLFDHPKLKYIKAQEDDNG